MQRGIEESQHQKDAWHAMRGFRFVRSHRPPLAGLKHCRVPVMRWVVFILKMNICTLSTTKASFRTRTVILQTSAQQQTGRIVLSNGDGDADARSTCNRAKMRRRIRSLGIGAVGNRIRYILTS